MEWQATDQFGNLNIGESDAQSLEMLADHVRMLVNEVRERVGDSFKVTVDMDYREISGPDPEQVSHILRVPWLAGQSVDDIVSHVNAVVIDYCVANGISGVSVEKA